MNNEGILYWITGLSGAGKTTVGTALYYKLKEKNKNIILLDGDLLKQIVEAEPEYTNDARLKRAYKYAKICKALVDQGLIVVCCTIAMYEEVRSFNRTHNHNYIEVFLDVKSDVLKNRDKKQLYKMNDNGKLSNMVGVDMDVDFPKNPDITIENNGLYSISECVNKILALKLQADIEITDDSSYWNNYYKLQLAPNKPSSFASFIEPYLIHDKKIVDLGCGNGRDAKYFGELKLNVIGVDLAQDIINKLSAENIYDNVSYIKDDFTLSNILFQQNFDYCYSRFTMHSIKQTQQDNLINNVFESLCIGGYFFIEARSTNDEIYGLGDQVLNEKNAFIYEDHYRRFINFKELKEQLINKGFTIVDAMEAKSLSKHGESDPTLIRIVARK